MKMGCSDRPLSDLLSSRSSDSISSYRSARDLPYTKMPVTLDNNQNYKNFEPDTTIIPNFYSIREEMRRELSFQRQDFVNNNLVSPDGPKARTPVSPIHTNRWVTVAREDCSGLV